MRVSVPTPRFRWVSERHLRLSFHDQPNRDLHDLIRHATQAVTQHPPAGLVAATPAYNTLLLEFTPDASASTDPDTIWQRLINPDASAPSTGGTTPRTIIIPVCYENDFAPDLGNVASILGMTRDDVVALHASAVYFVRFVGFSPGFGYLGGLPPQLVVPRLHAPRIRVPAGSIGIASDQTGVYPLATPGGWRLIGRTPRVMFDPNRDPAATLGIGDLVRFERIDEAAFTRLADEERACARA